MCGSVGSRVLVGVTRVTRGGVRGLSLTRFLLFYSVLKNYFRRYGQNQNEDGRGEDAADAVIVAAAVASRTKTVIEE